MDWLERMNKAIDYIEENLKGEIDLAQLARITGFSSFHFQKLFSLMAELPLGEYVRNRRLALPAADLQREGAKVLEVALAYGYDSPTAFNRAFKRLHGVSPRKARSKGVELKAFPAIAFHISIKGAVTMNYRIVDRKGFRAVGRRLKTTTVNGENFRRIPEFWEETTGSALWPKLLDMCKGASAATLEHPCGIMGICVVPPGEGKTEFDYYIAAASGEKVPEGMEELMLPDATYAVFESVGPIPSAIQELTKRIYREWLPGSGYELGNAPDIEVYTDGDTRGSDYRSEVWVPVKKKD